MAVASISTYNAPDPNIVRTGLSSASQLPPRRISTVAQRNGGNGHPAAKGTFKVKSGLAQMLKGGVIMDVVTIPVMAKCRIGHFVEAQILEALGVDYVDESEVLTPADEENHIDKH